MTYLEELKANLAKEQAARQQKMLEEELKATVAWQHAMSPLEQRLKRVLDDMPESIKTSGVSLPALQQLLKGRWQGNAHPGELGAALRKLGYVRKRCWRSDEVGLLRYGVNKYSLIMGCNVFLDQCENTQFHNCRYSLYNLTLLRLQEQGKYRR